MNESLLDSWIEAVLNIRNNRFLSELSLYEMVIIRTLMDNPDATASDLCIRTNLLKSQMNQILKGMEKKSLIRRERLDDDKRKVQLTLTPSAKETYINEHDRIELLVSGIEERLGKDKAIELSRLMREAIEVVRKDIK